MNFSNKEYMQLRSAALSTVNYTLHRYHASGYSWIDGFKKEDIVSDAVKKALVTFDPNRGEFGAWLRRQAFQMTVNELNGHRPTVDIYSTGEDDEMFETPEVAHNVTPESEVIGRETASIVREVLEGRSEMDAKVFMLDFQGYKPREIAERLDRTPGSVSVMLHRIKKAIKEKMSA